MPLRVRVTLWQCSALDLKVVSLILAHDSLVRGAALSLTLAELYGLQLSSLVGLFNHL